MAAASLEEFAERLGGLDPVRHRAVLAALAMDFGHLVWKIEFVDGEPDKLGGPDAGVHEIPYDRLVAPVLEGRTPASSEKSSQFIIGEYWDRLLGHCGRAHPFHWRVSNLAVVHEEPEKLLKAAVVLCDCGRCRPVKELGQEVLDMLAGDRGDGGPHPVLYEEGVEGPCDVEVAEDGAGLAALRAQGNLPVGQQRGQVVERRRGRLYSPGTEYFTVGALCGIKTSVSTLSGAGGARTHDPRIMRTSSLNAMRLGVM